MIDDVAQTYRKAKRASIVGAFCMYFAGLLSAFCFALFLLASLEAEKMNGAVPANSITALIATLLSTVSILLLGEFLRHFNRDSSPFGAKQSLRLLLAGLLLAIRHTLDLLYPFPPLVMSVSDSSSMLYVTSQPGPDLKVVVMVVFLICLAMVIRYGNALKEDSDSIA